jgi:hypothetical protein
MVGIRKTSTAGGWWPLPGQRSARSRRHLLAEQSVVIGTEPVDPQKRHLRQFEVLFSTSGSKCARSAISAAPTVVS